MDRAPGSGARRIRGRPDPAGRAAGHGALRAAAGSRGDRDPAVCAGRRLRRGRADLGPAPPPRRRAGPGPDPQRPGPVPRPAAPRPGRARGEPHPRPPARVQGPGHLGCPGPGTQAGRGEVRAGHRAVLGRAAPGADPQGPVRRPRQAAPGQVPPHPRDRHPAPGRTQGPRPAMAVVGRPRHPRPGPHLARLPAPLRHRDGLYATGKKGGVALWGRSGARSGSRPGRR